MLAPRFSRVNRQHSCSRLLPLTRSNTGDPVCPVVRVSESCTLPFRSSSPSFRPIFNCFSKMTSSAATVSPPQLNGALNSPPLAESGSTEEILRARLRELRVQVTQKAEQVRTLKQANAKSDEIGSCTEALAKLRLQLSELEKQVEGTRPLYYQLKGQCENLLKRRFFVVPAFEIYGGVGGLYDFGPPGCALKAAVEQLWRQHFVLAEDMLEVSGPCLTPHVVLKTSGHVDRFTDLMVKDVVTNDCLRADKYLEEKIDERLNAKEGISVEEETRLQLLRRQADALSVEEMKQAFVDLKIKSPADNDLSDPFPFNLMFGLKIGPKDEQAENAVSGALRVNNNSVKGNTNDPVASSSSSSSSPAGEAAASPSSLMRNKPAEGQGYLRPETAQGIFVNFRRLLEFNGGRMPFAAAQLGLGFRNEIAPRNGLLRVREFQMGEIEHFVHPDEKQHAKFPTVAHLKLPLFSRERQLTDGQVSRELTLQEAVARKVVDNETLGYFLARTYLFLRKCGIAETGLRFRQHLPSEMAHYAKDCWDAEVECSYGWVEVAGHADRAAYDLRSHSKASKVDLVAFRKYDEPRTVEYVKYTPNKGLCGKTFRDRQQALHSAVEERSDADKLDIEKHLATEGKYVLTLCTGERFEITREMMKFEKTTKKVSEEAYTPAVIEPSFGIGRVLHCIMEHSFRSRGIVDQEERCYMAFPAVIAPTKCVILPISSNAQFTALLQKARNSCLAKGLSTKVDASTASIGKRYARNDEVGTPFAITVDFRSLEDDTVTLRERDSMHQIRATLEEIVDLMAAMCAEQMSWAQVVEKHPLVTVKEDV